ncbi:MAG: GGDEF domain-containing protein [Legionellaceae bacterium]|nr:GGDEF domain-containing protein [Legionellaceae bacterium]
MSYPSMAFNFWRWIFILLLPGVFFLGWKLVIKPHEVKRLQVEATQTANKIIDGFSSRSTENLAAIERLFLKLEDGDYQANAVFIDELNTYFQEMNGLESFILPPAGVDGSLVLFNPYLLSVEETIAKEACTQALIEYPERLRKYSHVHLISVGNALCVYDPKLHMFAVLNLKTTLDEQLKQERMKGYFLALLEEQLPQVIPASSHFSWIHTRFFSFLGTEWKIHIYPSSAYIEASFRRVFRTFCITVGLGVLVFLGWFLRRRYLNTRVHSEYVAHLKKLALFDGVTDLPNRRHCLDHLNIVLKRAMRQKHPFSVCFMDCDGFKKINDDYGHHVGDQVLRHIADKVSQVIRVNDFFARFSGDEFCLILEGTASEDELDSALNKILAVIATPIEVGKNIISVTMSIGVAVYPEAGSTIDSLLEHADAAMYIAKRTQKNMYVIYQA